MNSVGFGSLEDAAARYRDERAERRRRMRARFVKDAGLKELDEADLAFGRHFVTHEPTGDRYLVYRGTIESGPVHPVTACYTTASGELVFLEPGPGAAR